MSPYSISYYDKLIANCTNKINKNNNDITKYNKLKEDVNVISDSLSSLIGKISQAEDSMGAALKIGGQNIFSSNYADLEEDTNEVITNVNTLLTLIDEKISELQEDIANLESEKRGYINQRAYAIEQERKNKNK